MTEDDVRACFDALSQGDVEPFAAWLREDCVLEFPGSTFGGTYEGARKIRVFLRQNQRLFEGGLRFTVHWAGAVDDRVVVQWTNAGRTRGGLDYRNRGVTVLRLREGRVARIEDYLDTEAVAEAWPR